MQSNFRAGVSEFSAGKFLPSIAYVKVNNITTKDFETRHKYYKVNSLYPSADEALDVALKDRDVIILKYLHLTGRKLEQVFCKELEKLGYRLKQNSEVSEQ